MLTLVISLSVQTKLALKHKVTEREIFQCFENKCGINLVDNREDHKTDPCTLWFISETNQGRLLKIAFMVVDGNFEIKTAFEPNDIEIRIYENLGK
jgi:hypothetical protein